MPFKHNWIPLLGLLGLLAACSGDRQVLKSPTAPRGLALLDGGLEPPTPLAFERATAWALVRDGEVVEVHVAHVDSAMANEAGFVPGAGLFAATQMTPLAEADGRGQRRFELELPPRVPGRVLYYWFEARDSLGETRRLPSAAPEGAVPVGSTRFSINFDWPGWSAPHDGLACWDDADLFDFEYAGAGPNFDEIVEPIWVPKENATIFASTVGSDEGVGVVVAGQPYFYPLNMMVWNEVANAEQGGLQTVLSYCPLTDTALFFSHQNTGKTRNWQTAGLYNSNLVLGDPREPRSLVPQILAFGVTGSREGLCVDILPSFLCRRSFWEALHPDTLVLNGDHSLAAEWNWLGLHNPYTFYWRSDSDIRAPIAHSDTAHPQGLHNKDLVVGVIGDGDPTVYPVHRGVPGGILVFNDDGGTRPMLLVWLEGPRFAAVFDRRHPDTGELLTFRRAVTSYQGVGLLEDDSAQPSLWTPEGLAIAGPHAGTQLAWLPSMRAFWFAWHASYPHARMVELPSSDEG